jgi:hypothetical protein
LLPWWWTTDERRRISDHRRILLFDAAEVLGSRTIKVAAEGGGQPVDPARFHDDFDRLASQAGNAGTRVALEFMPMTNLATLQAGVDFVTTVGNRYGGWPSTFGTSTAAGPATPRCSGSCRWSTCSSSSSTTPTSRSSARCGRTPSIAVASPGRASSTCRPSSPPSTTRRRHPAREVARGSTT